MGGNPARVAHTCWRERSVHTAAQAYIPRIRVTVATRSMATT